MALPNKSTASSYLGGVLAKVNNQNLPPDNQNTDYDNTTIRYAFADVAALTQTAPQAVCVITLATSTGGLVLVSNKTLWGNITTTAPALSRVATGLFTITYPATVSNEVDASIGITNNITTNFACAIAQMQSGSTLAFAQATASGNVITLNCFNSGGSANDLAGFQVAVVAW